MHKSMGLSNVNRRLRAVYGQTCGLRLDKNVAGGMTVTLKILREESAQTVFREEL